MRFIRFIKTYGMSATKEKRQVVIIDINDLFLTKIFISLRAYVTVQYCTAPQFFRVKHSY